MRIKVLVIDDDKFEMDEFINSINWNDLGFEIAGSAKNGFYGYKLYKETNPDLIITDIQMPGLSGIELTEKIREKDSKVRIMFLSSYGMFEYAQSGFQLDISGYILKQIINVDDTIKKLLDIKEEILQIKNYSKEKMENSLSKALQIDDWKLAESDIGALKEKTFNIYAVFEQNSIMPYKHMNNRLAVSSSYINIKQALQNYQKAYVVPHSSECILIFVETDNHDKQNQNYSFMSFELLDILTSIFYVPFVVFSFEKVYPARKIKEAVEQYMHVFDQRIFFKKNTIIPTSSINNNEEKINHKLNADLLDQIDKALDYNQLQSYMDEVFTPIISAYDYKTFYHCINILYLRLEQDLGTITDLKEEASSFFKRQNNNSITPAESTILFIKELYKKYYEYLSQNQERPSSVYVEEAIRYIHQNFKYGKIDIEAVAKHISLSTTRLSTIFKKQTDKTIHQYITDLRIGKTKHLLLDGKKRKLDSIAKEVGYLNGRYLSRVFKKEAGMSPEEYRKRGKHD